MSVKLFPAVQVEFKGIGVTQEQAQLNPIAQITSKGNEVINAKLFFAVTPVSFDPGQSSGQATFEVLIDGKRIAWTQHEKEGGSGFDTSQVGKNRVYAFDVPMLDVLKKVGKHYIQIAAGYEISNLNDPLTDPDPVPIWTAWSPVMVLDITEALS